MVDTNGRDSGEGRIRPTEAASTAQPSWPIRFLVERGKCLEMARVLQSSLPDYLQSKQLKAVPTFPVIMNHWGAAGSDFLRDLGCELTRVLHGTEEFEYPSGPLLEGMQIEGAIELVSRERKVNRSGRGMTILTFKTELSDVASRTMMVRIKRTIIELDAV